MQAQMVIDIFREALKIAFFLAGPILFSGLIAGLVINIFQAVTQLTESTLSIIPKLIIMVVVFALLAPWMLDTISDFTVQLMESIPQVVR